MGWEEYEEKVVNGKPYKFSFDASKAEGNGLYRFCTILKTTKNGEDTDTRSPEEKQADAAAVEKILRTEYTLEEAKSFGFYQKKNTWYDSNGNVVGKLWYVDGKQLIIK